MPVAGYNNLWPNDRVVLHGQDAQDLSNFKHPIVSNFCWYSFIAQNFILKNFKISLSRAE